MFRLDEVSARLAERVPALAGRLGHAGGFAQMIKAGQVPQQTPAGFVLPGGFGGGSVNAMTGMFVQDFTETVMLVVVVRVASDPLGTAALDEITPIVRDCIAALAGWGPADASGVFVLARGELVGATGGALMFEINFSLTDQLRITA